MRSFPIGGSLLGGPPARQPPRSAARNRALPPSAGAGVGSRHDSPRGDGRIAAPAALPRRGPCRTRGRHALGRRPARRRGPRGRRGDRAPGGVRARRRQRRRDAPRRLHRQPARRHRGHRRTPSPADDLARRRRLRHRGPDADGRAALGERDAPARPLGRHRGVRVRARPHRAPGEGDAAQPAHARQVVGPGDVAEGLSGPLRRVRRRHADPRDGDLRARRPRLPLRADRRDGHRHPHRPRRPRAVRRPRDRRRAHAGRGHRPAQRARRQRARRRHDGHPPLQGQQRGPLHRRRLLRADRRPRVPAPGRATTCCCSSTTTSAPAGSSR